MEAHDVDVIDMTDDGVDDGLKRSHESSPEPRRTQRKVGSRVFFGEVMAQEREMERIQYEKSRQHQFAPRQLRKGETVGSPVKRLKQKRAEERRSARQKLRRNMSPRSPDGVPQLPLRGGASLMKLKGDAQPQSKRRFARDEDAIQDASLHSTAWRNVKLKDVPVNLLPDREDVLQPFALPMDAALDEFDAILKSKCVVSTEFLKPKPLTVMSGTLGKARDTAEMDDKVRQVIDEATLMVKRSHAARVKAIVASTRRQIAAYLKDQPAVRAKTLTANVGFPLQISRLEKVAARKLLRNAEFVLDGEESPHYSVGRNESGYSEQVYPKKVTYLSKIAPLPRSTTCTLACGTHRVEDDPIIRFVPYFSAGSNGKLKGPQVSTMEPCKDTLVGMDDEVKEFILRYAVSACGSDQNVFDALQRTGAFLQPFANYFDVLNRVTREQLWERQLHELEAQQGSNDIPDDRKRAIALILNECRALRSGTRLCDRLRPFPTHVLLNCMQRGNDLGVRDASSKQYRELAVKYQDLFCRRCCVYGCRNHGCEQPIPVVRVDPRYPVVKAASKLWRRAEEEQLQSAEDADVEMDGEETPESDVLVSELTPTSDSSVNDEKHQTSVSTNTADDISTRRTLRARTAACTTASSNFVAVRVHTKKMVRSKTSDVSEYLGFDGVYQAITQDKKLEILSTDCCCGPRCSKLLPDTVQSEERHGFSTMQDKLWKGSEIALLNKLESCVDQNPCAIAALLATRSCADVASFLQKRKKLAQDDLYELRSIGTSVYGRNRERSNGAFGNSYEHLRRTRSQRMKDRGANHEYVPCNHDGGSCDSAQCSCMRRDHYCEKSCGCSPDCSNRFPGCHCEAGQCQASDCPCYYAARECDPDVCTSCGASELPVAMVDEKSKSKSVAQLKICGNINILRGKMRKIGISASETHGWGAYALENVKKGEFIYEYTGSLLSQDEAERRGNVYDKTTISFLFDLTEDSVVDATRKGNKSKFANHDSTEPKCFARIMHVNGDHRIGIYAKEDIAAGDELFFDYGYSGVIPDWSQARIGPSKDPTPIEVDNSTKVNLVDTKEASSV